MEPDSKMLIAGDTDWSTKAGIFELGLISTKPDENWSPSPILIR